ncbi:hypothetical protein [Kitasatospora purpeofusca]|uniref:hypothetical protein n=1 Tax=Kitasatospora purpeofusca TaxID=67352 RepID=UPI0036599E5D
MSGPAGRSGPYPRSPEFPCATSPPAAAAATCVSLLALAAPAHAGSALRKGQVPAVAEGLHLLHPLTDTLDEHGDDECLMTSGGTAYYKGVIAGAESCRVAKPWRVIHLPKAQPPAGSLYIAESHENPWCLTPGEGRVVPSVTTCDHRFAWRIEGTPQEARIAAVSGEALVAEQGKWRFEAVPTAPEEPGTEPGEE